MLVTWPCLSAPLGCNELGWVGFGFRSGSDGARLEWCKWFSVGLGRIGLREAGLSWVGVGLVELD